MQHKLNSQRASSGTYPRLVIQVNLESSSWSYLDRPVTSLCGTAQIYSLFFKKKCNVTISSKTERLLYLPQAVAETLARWAVQEVDWPVVLLHPARWEPEEGLKFAGGAFSVQGANGTASFKECVLVAKCRPAFSSSD